MNAGAGAQWTTSRAWALRRRVVDVAGRGIAGICALGAAATLLLIVGYIVQQGSGALSLSFLTHLPTPVGIPGGGVGNGIAGTLEIVGIAACMAFPVGVLVGVYLATHWHHRLAQSLTFLADVLSGVPSITIGIFAYVLLVAPLHHFSAISASFAFAILMLPLVIRGTEGAVRLVPPEIPEAATALGAAPVHVTMVVLQVARPGIVTGLILALARVTGETAPLLFTAFGTQFWEFNPNRPMAELSLQIFTYAISPYKDWHRQAWAGALLLVFAVFALSILARLSLWRRRQPGT